MIKLFAYDGRGDFTIKKLSSAMEKLLKLLIGLIICVIYVGICLGDPPIGGNNPPPPTTDEPPTDPENGSFEVLGKSFYSRGAVGFVASWKKGKNPGWKINSTPAAVPNKKEVSI